MNNIQKCFIYSRNILLLKTIVLILFFTVFTFSGCTLDLFDDMKNPQPTVEISSVTSTDNVLTIRGRVNDDGANKVKYYGFCYNNTGNPGLLENQILLSSSDGFFIAVLPDLEPETRYYFKAFAANDVSYSESMVYIFDTPPTVVPTVPCALTNMTLTDNGFDYSIWHVYQGEWYANMGNYGIDLSCYYDSGPTVEFSFHNMPETGIYKTSNYDTFDDDNNNVFVTVHSDLYQYMCHTDANVYIENIDNDSIVISFCDLVYSTENSEIEVSGKASFAVSKNK